MTYYKLLAAAIVAIFLYVIATSQNAIDYRLERANHLKSQTGDVRIALVWPSTSKESFIKGARLAEEAINSSEGALLGGRKLKIDYYDEYSDDDPAHLARGITANKDYIASVGYLSSNNALPSSVVYEASGMLMINAGATNPRITGRTSHFIFRTISNDAQNGRMLAKLTADLGYKRVLLLNVRSPYGFALSNYYKEHASKLGLRIVAQKSYNYYDADFKPMFAQIGKLGFDAVFLAGSGASAANVIKQARQMWVEQPIIGADGLNNEIIPKIAGRAAEGLITFGFMDPDTDYTKLQDFLHLYRERYKEEADDWAAQGYDVIDVLSQAIKRASSIDPTVLASTFRYAGTFFGPAGPYSFNSDGDIVGGNFVPKKLVDGKFVIYKMEE